MKILIVFSSEDENKVYRELLVDYGFSVISTNNLDNIEKIILEEKPEILVIDYSINKDLVDDLVKYFKKIKIKLPYLILLFANIDNIRDYKKGTLGEQSCLLKGSLLLEELPETLSLIRSQIVTNQKIKTAEFALIETENYFKKLFDFSQDAIFFVDKNTGLYLDANNAALELTGLTLEEIKEKHTYDLSPQGFDRMKRVKDAKESVDLGEVSYLRPDGSERIALLSAIPLKENIILGIAKDITDRKKYENYIKQSEITYRNILNEISELIFIQDESGRFLDVNRAVEILYGYTKEEFIGRTAQFLSAEGFNDLNKISKILAEAFYGTVSNFEFWGKTKHGKVFPKEVYVYPGTYFGKKVVIAVARDVTERKVSENLLKQTISRNSAILNAIPDLIFIFDNQYKIVDCSYNSNAPLLMPPKMFLGRFVGDVFPDYLRDLTYKNIDKVLSSGEIVTDFYSLEINNSIKYFESRYVKSGENEVLAIVRDISEQKKVESALNENKSIFHTIIDNAPFEIWARNLDMVCILENKLLIEHWGSLLGTKPDQNRITPDEFKIWDENNKRALSGEVVNYEVEYEMDGNIKIFQNIVAPIFDSEKTPIGIAGFNIDITERKLVEQELIKQKEKAIESDNLKTAFLQNISHEIRTPLNGIIGFSNLLQFHDLSKEEINDYTKMIQQSGYRLIEVVNNILEISKIETGQIKINNKQFSLNSLIEDEFQSLKKLAEERDIDFKYITTLSDENSIVVGDEIKILQVLSNLLNNAFKFTISGKITFGYTIQDNYVEFFVKDTGIGISKEDQIRIFDRFIQTDNSISRGYEGAGLGLAICKGLVGILGGKIWLESKPDVGSDFYFTVPFVAPQRLKKNNDLSNLNKSIKTVLIAEDDLVSFKYLKTLLEKKDIQIIHAENGQDAIYYATNYPNIDLILMDIRMPIIDGVEATKEIKKIKPKVPIIAQTAYSFNEERRTIIDAGCDDYIVKPIDKEQLEAILERFSVMKRIDD